MPHSTSKGNHKPHRRCQVIGADQLVRGQARGTGHQVHLGVSQPATARTGEDYKREPLSFCPRPSPPRPQQRTVGVPANSSITPSTGSLPTLELFLRLCSSPKGGLQERKREWTDTFVLCILGLLRLLCGLPRGFNRIASIFSRKGEFPRDLNSTKPSCFTSQSPAST